MKQLLIVLLPISLFLFCCEDSHVVNKMTIIKSQFGFGGKTNGSSLEYLWFLGNNIAISFPYDSDDYGGVIDTEYDGWNFSYERDDLELFQSEGYFNYVLRSNPTIKRTIQLDDYYDDMMWEE